MHHPDSLVELKHIQLELSHNRTRNMRHFVDQYYCYKHGYVTRTGSPKWDLIFFNENEFMSTEARAILGSSTKITNALKDQVVKEHVVPLNIIIKELVKRFNNGMTSLDEIASCIDKHLIFATISKEEDKRLREHKLQSKMPEGYYLSQHPLFNNKFARYEVAGITK